MNDPHTSFWSHFADRLRGHRPPPPADQGWAQMRGLLDANPPTPAGAKPRGGRLWPLLLLLLGLGLGLYAVRYAGSTPESPAGPAVAPESRSSGTDGAGPGVREVEDLALRSEGPSRSPDPAATPPASAPGHSTASAFDRRVIETVASAGRPARKTSSAGREAGRSQAPANAAEASPPASAEAERADHILTNPDGPSSPQGPAQDGNQHLAWLSIDPKPLPTGPARLPSAPMDVADGTAGEPGLGWILGLSVADPVPGEWQMTFSPVTGLFYHRPLGGNWSGQAEFLIRYTRMRDLRYQYRWEDISPQGEYRFLERSQALEGFFSLDLPILLHYRLHRRWHLEGGLRYSLILEQGSSGSIRGNLPRSVGDMPGRMLWHHDAGVTLGAGFHFRGGTSLHLRYTQGLRDLSPDDLYGQRRNHLNTNLQLHIQQNF